MAESYFVSEEHSLPPLFPLAYETSHLVSSLYECTIVYTLTDVHSPKGPELVAETDDAIIT